MSDDSEILFNSQFLLDKCLLTSATTTTSKGEPQNSPPHCEVDEASIQKAMDKNKESLKVKLMLRRPISQLVDQGIMPPLKSSPVFYEQTKKLERARVRDFLKHKIEKRPDRQALIDHHILEDTTVSPSLQDKQRLLKKARLADDLNDRLSHRPGPLELIKGNILVADEKFAEAVKQGQIQFKSTSEGEAIKHPNSLFVVEGAPSEDGGSSSQDAPFNDKDSVDLSAESSPVETTINEESTTAVTLISIPPSSLDFNNSSSSSSTSFQITKPFTTVNFTHVSTVPTLQQVVPTTAVVPTTPAVIAAPETPAFVAKVSSQPSHVSNKTCGDIVLPTKEVSATPTKNRKKTKSKTQPKTKTIKFHEYKGPPNSQKKPQLCTDSTESSYELLLKQQQLFLQWQLEWQQKYPQLILPASQKTNSEQSQESSLQSHQFNILAQNRVQSQSENDSGKKANYVNNNSNNTSSQGNGVFQLSSKGVTKLEDMKVSDLKSALKKRNLPVSGSKPQLIERLRQSADDNTPTQVDKDVTQGALLKTANANNKTAEIVTNGVCRQNLNGLQDAGPVSPLLMEVDGRIVENSIVGAINGVEGFKQDELPSHHSTLHQLQKPELQLQLQNQTLIQNQTLLQNQTHALTIPLTAITAPQIQFISATPVAGDATCTISTKALQRQLVHQQLQQKIQQNQQNQLASALQNQVSQQQQHFDQTRTPVTTIPAFLTTQVIDAKTFSSLPQVFFYPNTIAAPPQQAFGTAEAPFVLKQERTNSVPNVLQQKIVSQRTSSLPNFTPLIKTVEIEEIEKNDASSKRPPDYEEATKQMSTADSNVKAKESKNEEMEDLLRILAKHVELQPTSTEQLPIVQSEPKSSTSASEMKDVTVKKEENPVDSSQQDLHLDFDFSDELHELAASMDFNMMQTKKNDSNYNESTSYNDFSFGEFMEFSGPSDDTDWFSGLLPTTTHESVHETHHKDAHAGPSSSNTQKRSGLCPATRPDAMDWISASNNQDHDPLLPNSMFCSSHTDPFMDYLLGDVELKPAELTATSH